MVHSGKTNSATVAAHVVDLLLGDAPRAAVAAHAMGASGEWPAALALATRWRVLPAFAERLAGIDTAGAGFGRESASSLRAQTAICAMQSAAAVRRAGTALRDLADAGVPAVAIKGIAAIATLYGASSRRMVSDADVVIRAADLGTARTALANRGYIDRSPPFERHVSDIALSRSLHNFARTFVRDGFEIDLHWQFGPRPPTGLRVDRIIERATTIVVEGQTLRVAGPIEAALLTSHHALRGAFRATTTVKDLLDVAFWWDIHGSRHAAELIEVAGESNLASSLLALVLALAARNPGHSSGAAIASLERRLGPDGRAQARALFACFDDAVRGEAPDEATLALFAPGVFLRSLWGLAYREIAWQARGSAPPAPHLTVKRRPVMVRVLRRLARGWRIGRELSRFRRMGTYRAVAHAQSRFH